MRRLKRVVKVAFPKSDPQKEIYVIPQGIPVEMPVHEPVSVPLEKPQKEKTYGN